MPKNLFYAIITARKNSKQIKNKNIQKIGKKNLVENTISIIKKVNFFDKIFCSSDSNRILDIAKKNKIIDIKRPKKLSLDSSKSITSIHHFVKYLKENNFELPKVVFLFQPTSPFVKEKTILSMKRLVIKKKVSSVISCYKIPNKFHYLNQRSLKNGKVKFLYEKIRNKKILKQSKPAVYSHGNLFSFKLKEFLKQNSLTPKPLYSILLDTFEESIDIDTKEDIRIARALFKKFKFN